MARADRPARPTATPARLASWLPELARTVPGVVTNPYPRPIGARARRRIVLAVSEANGCRSCAWVHGGWQEFLGEGPPDDPAIDDALLDYARACARAGAPVDPAGLQDVLGASAARAVRATVARAELASLVGNSAERLIDRMRRRQPARLLPAMAELAAVALVTPVAVPWLAAAGLVRLANRLAPPAPVVHGPAGDQPNLLAVLLAEGAPTYLSSVAARTLVAQLPFPVAIAVRAGRTAATVVLDRRRISIHNGIHPNAALVLEGDVEPLLRAASGAIVREAGDVGVGRR
jgi:hypothetical protein